MQTRTHRMPVGKPLVICCMTALLLSACGGSGNNSNVTVQPQTPVSPKIDTNGSNVWLSDWKAKSSTDIFANEEYVTYDHDAITVKPLYLNKLVHDYDIINENYKTNDDLILTPGKNKETTVTFKRIIPQLNEDKAYPADLKTLTIKYSGEVFGYKNAKAAHYYARFGNSRVPFGETYSIGTESPVQALEELPKNAQINYRGSASFKAYNDITDKLQMGEAAFVLDTGKKAITQATISVDKKYEFATYDKPLSVANGSKFNSSFMSEGYVDATAPQALHGHFYGANAEHIGGTYYTREGIGAFITEKQ